MQKKFTRQVDRLQVRIYLEGEGRAEKMNDHVLFVSPHSDDAYCLSQMLSPVALACDHVPDLHHARAKLRNGHYPVVLTEAGLPDGSWLDVLSLVRGATPGAEVIVTDRDADARFWAEVLNRGGYDMLAQPFHESEVRRILSNACSRPEAKGPGHTAL